MKNLVRVERARHRLTQKDLADIVGVTQTTINSIENKEYQPSALLVLRIAHYFKVAVNDLFFLDEEDKKYNIPRERKHKLKPR